jgi:hypothetical protein
VIKRICTFAPPKRKEEVGEDKKGVSSFSFDF